MIRENKVKQTLKNGGTVIGTFIKFSDPAAVEIIGLSGFDFFVLDNEHVAMNRESMTNICRTADISGIVPIVRIRVNNPVEIMQALDAGALGVQIPNVDTYEQALSAVQSARYAPKGNRGFAPSHRAGAYGMMDKAAYIRLSNEQVLTVLHCETLESVQNLDSILELPELDVIFIGPMDLSQSMGPDVMGNRNHPELNAVIDQTIAKVVRSGKAVGTIASNLEMAEDLMRKGCRYMLISSDQDMVVQTARKTAQTLKQMIP